MLSPHIQLQDELQTTVRDVLCVRHFDRKHASRGTSITSVNAELFVGYKFSEETISCDSAGLKFAHVSLWVLHTVLQN